MPTPIYVNWKDDTEAAISGVFGSDLTGTGLAGPLYGVTDSADPRYLAWYNGLYENGFLNGFEVVPDGWTAPVAG